MGASDFQRKMKVFYGNSNPSQGDGWLGRACAAARRQEEYAIKVVAESADEIQAAVADLKANELKLSAPYRKHFNALSPHHQRDFQPSFLVPPADVVERNRLDKVVPCCANPACGREEGPKDKFNQCVKCRSAMYCQKACQKEHWPTHKKVCCKSADEVSRGIESGRESLVFPLDTSDRALRSMSHDQRERMFELSAITGEPLMGGSLNLNLKTTFRTADGSRQGKIPKNVHGDKEFSVKVQIPLGGGASGSASDDRCMVYDKGRTFEEQYFSPMQYGRAGEKIESLIRAQPGQLKKGYFLARREGTNVRIFTDRIIPFPIPPW